MLPIDRYVAELSGEILSVMGKGHWNLPTIVPYGATESILLPCCHWGLIVDCASAKTHLHTQAHDGNRIEDSHDVRKGGRRWRRRHSFRLRPIMKQGTAAGIPETWTHYPSVEDARAGAKLMYHNDRVLRVMVVSDSVGSFVEWIER